MQSAASQNSTQKTLNILEKNKSTELIERLVQQTKSM